MKLSSRNIFLISYVIYYFGLTLEITAISCSHIIKIISMIIALFGFSTCVYSGYFINCDIKKKSIHIIIAVLLFLLMSVYSKDYFFIMMIVIFFSSKCITLNDLEKVFQLSLRIIIIISLIAVIGCLIGFVPNINTPRSWGGTPRLAWGFYHSQIPTLLFFYVLMYYYGLKKCINKKDFILSLIFSYILSVIFDCRNAFYSLIIFMIIVVIHKVFSAWKLNDKMLLYFSYIAPVFFVFFTFISVYLYKNFSIGVYLDKLLSSRIRVSMLNLSIIRIKFISFVSYSKYSETLVDTVDNGYLYILFRYGYVIMLLVLCLFTKIPKYYFIQKNMIGLIAFITICSSCFISNGYTGCYFMPYWIVALKMLNVNVFSSDSKCFDSIYELVKKYETS